MKNVLTLIDQFGEFEDSYKVLAFLKFLGVDLSEDNVEGGVKEAIELVEEYSDFEYAFDGNESYKILTFSEIDDELEYYKQELIIDTKFRIPADLQEYFDFEEHANESFQSLFDIYGDVNIEEVEFWVGDYQYSYVVIKGIY